MAFKMKGFEPHNMYKTKKANTHKDHLALEKKGYDHNPYKKASSFTKTNGDDKKKIAENQDPATGESKQEQALSIIKAMESDLKRLREEGRTENELKQLKLSLAKNKKEYQEKYPQIFE